MEAAVAACKGETNRGCDALLWDSWGKKWFLRRTADAVALRRSSKEAAEERKESHESEVPGHHICVQSDHEEMIQSANDVPVSKKSFLKGQEGQKGQKGQNLNMSQNINNINMSQKKAAPQNMSQKSQKNTVGSRRREALKTRYLRKSDSSSDGLQDLS